MEKELRKIFNDDDFVLGIKCDLRSDDDIDTVLQFIHETEDVESEDVILFSMDLVEPKS